MRDIASALHETGEKKANKMGARKFHKLEMHIAQQETKAR
jgi:hypothetical protein